MADVPIRDVAVMLYDLDDDQVQHLLDDLLEVLPEAKPHLLRYAEELKTTSNDGADASAEFAFPTRTRRLSHNFSDGGTDSVRSSTSNLRAGSKGSFSSEGHQLFPRSWKTRTNCDVCGKEMKKGLLSKTTLECELCGIRCHKACRSSLKPCNSAF